MIYEKPIPFGAKYIMKPGMTYRDICIGMRLDDTEIEAGILALRLINGPEESSHLSSSISYLSGHVEFNNG
ncbi:MAG: hypothetical protein EAZ74_04465 [Alphaproteobacteria bacterium]|nr:MAG: hypothetical protein EAY76_00770 [Alphaproteobacteria bacterium]TAF14208.1 MAG: hypothetical protein EAZ74_04465 [Alphaproteobacteria bacterium]TAF39330.1 MAG: hypothetical protein EAZ66_04940 [Alphaproteobacteria bacterium]TAF76917.1 MAG: hypothetical protein EAZ52_02010 [Alphaproteobacteria bacterium]